MLSVTIRPRSENFKLQWVQVLSEHFKKKKMKYVIAIEKNNHLQCAFETHQRSNNMRRTITGLLKYTPEDDAESKVWLKIVSHDNPKYLLGYCNKELVKDKIETNYSSEYIDECIQYYTSQKKEISEVKKYKEWICTGINSLPYFAYEFAVKNGLDTTDFHALVNLMFAKNMIPFSLSRKIKKKDNLAFDMFVKTREQPDISDADLMNVFSTNYELLFSNS